MSSHTLAASSERIVAGPRRKFRLIPAIDERPAFVEIAQTSVGKIAIVFAFYLGVRFTPNASSYAEAVAICLLLMSFLPEYRRFILAVAPALLVLRYEASLENLGIYGGVLAVGVLLFLGVRRWPGSRIAKRPVASLLTGFSLVIALACGFHNQHLWTLVGVLSAHVWFIAYALTDRSAHPRVDGTLELATFNPLWGSTHTPYAKGAAYLRRIEAHDSPTFAKIQLKGLKLLAWALVLLLIKNEWVALLHGYLRIPSAAQALHASVIGKPFVWHIRWESQILGFFEDILTLSISGHVIIAGCRMAGFNALRNTYRPLSSTTLADFFNRYYYYFKELLVDFFFFPAYLRYFKKHKRLRLAFANFSAACFGNAFFHFTRDWALIRDLGLLKAFGNFQVYIFYSVALAAGLTISQLRKNPARSRGWLRGHAFPILGVMLFYCLLNVFGATQRNYALAEHFRFLVSLFTPWA